MCVSNECVCKWVDPVPVASIFLILGAEEVRNRWRMWWLVDWCEKSVWAVTVLS